MFANFPGFMYSDVAGRQATNEFRVPPGGGVKIQTGNRPIGDVIAPIPYKEVGQGMLMLTQQIEKTAQRVGGTAEIMTPEGRGDMPVGTTLAMIEQATKILSAVHVRLHAAQAEEFQLLKERFREDPSALWRHNRRPARKWEVDVFLAALENVELTPASDPNTPSRMHRIMAAVAVKQLQAAAPELYNGWAVDSMILKMIGIQNPDSLRNNNPTPPPPDPAAITAQAKIAEIAAKGQQMQAENTAKMQELAAEAADRQHEHQLRAEEIATESADRAGDRASRERVANAKLQSEEVRQSAAFSGPRAPRVI